MPDPAPGAVRAVLFDLDDTLVPLYTLPRWQWAWRPNGPVLPDRHVRAAVRRELHAWDRRRWHGLVGSEPPATTADFRAFLRSSLLAIADRPLPDEEVSAVVERFARPLGPMERYPDVEPTLRQLASRGIAYAVVSTLPEAAARAFLHRAGLDEGRLTTGPSDALPPPDCGAFKRALGFLGLPAPEVAFVGDLYWSDTRAAARIGLRAILIDRENRTPPAAGARIASLSELPAVLSQGPAREEPAADAPGDL